MDAACKLSSCSCFLEGNPRQRLSRTVRLSFPTSRVFGCSITHSSSFLISDPGGCFVSNELREWASVRSIGLLTAPGEFHGLTADLENLIRVIRRLARKLADDHPELTLASCRFAGVFFPQQWFHDWKILASPMGSWRQR